MKFKNIPNEEWKKDVFVTLHGYLRILPPHFTKSSNIYNGHPGAIHIHPDLKGFNPQKNAWEANHIRVGCVIHKVTPILDDGPIIEKCLINNISCELYQCIFTSQDRDTT